MAGKRGRPKIHPADVAVAYMTVEEKAAMTETARQLGFTLGEFLLRSALAAEWRERQAEKRRWRKLERQDKGNEYVPLLVGIRALCVRCRRDFLRRTFRQAFRNVTADFSAAFLFYPTIIALPRHRLERP